MAVIEANVHEENPKFDEGGGVADNDTVACTGPWKEAKTAVKKAAEERMGW